VIENRTDSLSNRLFIKFCQT